VVMVVVMVVVVVVIITDNHLILRSDFREVATNTCLVVLFTVFFVLFFSLT